MLRYSIISSQQRLSSAVRSRTATQSLSQRPVVYARVAGQRFYADPPKSGSVNPTPATPSTQSSIPPENIPKNPPTRPSQGQTSPPISVSPPPPPVEKPNKPAASSSTPPPPPPPARKTGRFGRFFVYFILASGLAYGGAVFLALRYDNFHDFFTEYIPFGEESVLYFEERDFRRRFPNATRHANRLPPIHRDESSKVTIPGRSGLSWKVSEGDDPGSGSDLTRKGRHMSAVESTDPKEHSDPGHTSPEARSEAVKQAKATRASKKEATPEPKPKPEPKSEPKPEPPKTESKPEPPKEEPRKPAIQPVTTIELLSIKEGDEPVVQELVKVFNDIITVISADGAADRFSAPINKAKTELATVGEKLTTLKNEAKKAAEEEIQKAHATFDESARELIRRIDEARAAEAAQFREEFETEREKLSRAYQEKVRTEVQRAQEIAEQRLQNELVEQAIELNRKYLNDVKELVEREREGRLSKLSELSANVTQLEKLASGWSDVIDTNLKTQQLQVAIDAVRTVLEQADRPRPFVRELVAVKELAADDPVVAAAIASINPSAYQRGIPPTPEIIDRFRRVANEVRKASLLPEDAGIASHAASLMMNKLMFKKDGLGGGDDVESVLTRTENLLEEGNLDAAAREMNSLQGWAKILSKDWLADVRRVLEVKQALDVMETEARLQCLRVES